MTAAFNARITSAAKETAGISKLCGIPRTGAGPTWSFRRVLRVWIGYKFLAFAGTPQPQLDLTRYMPYGVANKDAMALVEPAVLPSLANAPDHDARALNTDFLFWSDKGDDLRQRFTAWLAKQE
nr:hypothetical protein [Bradyrhizobium sp. WSM1743]